MFSFEIPEQHVIVTASSDGFIKMWKLEQDKVSALTQSKCTLIQILLGSEVEYFLRVIRHRSLNKYFKSLPGMIDINGFKIRVPVELP